MTALWLGAWAGAAPAANAETATFGKTTVGAQREVFAAERKRVNAYSLPIAGTVSQLSLYLEPTGFAGRQEIEGVIYADSSGAPGALVAVSSPLTFASTQAAGWYPLPLPSAVELPAGTYWIGEFTGPTSRVAGYRYDNVAGARAWNHNMFTSGPSNPFGAVYTDSQQISLYATYSPAVPLNTGAPAILHLAQQGQTLTEVHGEWTNNPTSFRYQWLQCDSLGEACLPISGATAQTYVPVAADVGHKLMVQETASNAGGASSPATSEATAVVFPAAPALVKAPAISGTAQQERTLTEAHGEWTNNPTSFRYQWLRCNSLGEGCMAISGAAAQTYVPVAGDMGRRLRVREVASNEGGGGFPATSEATAVVVAAVAAVPAMVKPPTISGTAQQGKTLTEAHGEWTNSPTSYAYQWQQCDGSGSNCTNTVGATAQTYVPVATDVGHRLRVQETATNAGGSSVAGAPEATAVVVPAVPMNAKAPTISGAPQQEKTLAETHGEWTNSPTGYTYQWLQCSPLGEGCLPISGATAQTYVPVAADVGRTLRVQETAANAGGASAAATSGATAPVAAAGSSATFGKTSVGALRDGGMFANYKILHSATLSTAGSVTKLSLYAVPGIHSPSPQSLKAVLYADSGGSPGVLLASGTEVTYRGNVNGSGWLALPFPAPVALSPGTYWLGFITGAETVGMGYVYDKATGSRAYNANAFAAGPSNPFGAATKDSEQASIYATYVPASWPPENMSRPEISGAAATGQTLTASPGTWSGSPTSFAYAWQRCDGTGANCAPIAGATATTYAPAEADVGKTLRVAVTATNEAGTSTPAPSVQTAIVTSSSAGVQHLEYVLQDGTTSVYDMDHEYKLVKTISLPSTKDEVRGVTVAPSTHIMYVMHGGDGPINGSGNGSVLAYDLVQEKVLWDVKLNTGIDSGQVSPDAKTLYIATGENTSSGIWNMLSAANGELIGTIQGGAGAHNTVVSNDGHYVYLGGRSYNFLGAYETATGSVKQIGPLVGSVRPFAVNGSNTLAFTTATGFDGFQIASITTGNVLFTVSFGEVPGGFPFSGPSHGIGISPDEKQAYVIDAVHKQVQFWDVSRVKEGIAPTQIGVVPVAGLTGTESPCAYDCGRGGWLQLSLDGRYLFVGDSGEVIDTATRKVITTFSTLAQTKKSIEVDWQNGVPVATSGRTGVGYVE